MIFNKLSKRERMLTYVVVLVVFLFLIERGVIVPFSRKLEAVSLRIKQEEVRTKNALLVQSQREDILAEYENYKKYLTKPLSPQEGMAEVLKEIERLSKEAHLSVESLDPRQKSENYWRADLRGSGELGEILYFLYKVQESPLLMRVESFSISLKTQKERLLNFTISLARDAL